ncbi:MAG: nuclear transport factor 2 family protein [bacterium]|nr:nuclear transport factor 2 family protein [Betaproteobacteria bacterium]
MSDDQQLLSMIAAFGLHADARDWDAEQQVFATEVFVDYSSLFGGSGQTLTSAQLMDNWRALLPGFTRTQHTIGVPLITVEGRSARASAPFIAHHFIEDPAPEAGSVWIVGGRYEWTFEQTDGRWQVSHLVLSAGWQDGNRGLPGLAMQRARLAAE